MNIIIFTFVLLEFVVCENNLVRRKRFFNSLWPSDDVEKDVQTGLIYSQLPAEYLHLLPGVNDHLIQRRADSSAVQTSANNPSRFVHPTRMPQLVQPFYHQNIAPVAPRMPQTHSQTIQQQNTKSPKIVMRPNLAPTFTLKTREQALPEIHKSHRFVMPKPINQLQTQKPNVQQVPLKKSYETSRERKSIKSASIQEFYETREFHDLIDEFNLKVETNKLPPINDVMSALGTTNAEDTLDTIREVVNSKEGIEFIRSYMESDANFNANDEFYNYDDDVGAGEIKVNQQVPQPFYLPPIVAEQDDIRTQAQIEEPRTWWKPSTWFNTSPKHESLQKDADLLKKIVKLNQQTPQQNAVYIHNFVAPSNQAIPIHPPYNTGARAISQQPLMGYQNTAINAGAKFMPTVRMTEDQFKEMVEVLQLKPISSPINGEIKQQIPMMPTKSIQITEPAAETTTKTTTTTSTTTTTTEKPIERHSEKFTAPIYAQMSENKVSILPLPTFVTPIENRRNFVAESEPQRSSPYDFIASDSSSFFKANPEEVLREEEKLVSNISDLTQSSLKSE